MRYKLRKELPMMAIGTWVEPTWKEDGLEDYRAIKQDGFSAVIVVPKEKWNDWIEEVHECGCEKCVEK